MRILTLFIIILTLNSCDFTSARTYFTEATKFEEQNNLTEAINLLNKAILKDGNYIPAYINRAVDKAMLGDYASAIEDYDIVLKKDPENTLALLNRGKNKHRLDDYKGAVQDFQKALDSKVSKNIERILKPNNKVDLAYDCSDEEIRLERGVSLYFLGNLNRSFADIQFCIERSFEKRIALYWRGMIYISSNQKVLGCKDLNESSSLGNEDATHDIGRFCR
jgi:tetratricopeptide (TPR) repeat protein